MDLVICQLALFPILLEYHQTILQNVLVALLVELFLKHLDGFHYWLPVQGLPLHRYCQGFLLIYL